MSPKYSDISCKICKTTILVEADNMNSNIKTLNLKMNSWMNTNL